MKNLAKIVMIIPCWKRSDIFSLTINQLDYFFENTRHKIDLTVLYVFSLNDPELMEHLQLYRSATHSRDMIYSPNEKLGQKINDGIFYAGLIGYDYIMNSGSDDLYNPEIIDWYLPFINMEIPFFGLKSCWFYEFGKVPFFFDYYNGDHMIGAGRMIHKTVIESVTAKYEVLYEPTINRGMDTMSAQRILKCGFQNVVIDTGNEAMIVDVKSDVNINTFDQINAGAINSTSFKDENFELFGIFPLLKKKLNE